MAKKTPWGWIIFGIVAFTMLVGVSLIAVAGFVVYQQFAFKSTPSTARSAEQKFEEVAKRFEGQTPLLVIEDGEPVLRRPTATRSRARIEALHVMVWEPDDERVVSLNIPFWLIRMTNGHPIKLSAGDDHTDARPQLKITAADLERHGPGLILMHGKPGGERVIVWAQ
ncbi:MAG: hypothetical protein Q7V01_03510 [Vicinamibacterales bacterium]|nr:hypothetical protein [Vicinamibacterales bacterium]